MRIAPERFARITPIGAGIAAVGVVWAFANLQFLPDGELGRFQAGLAAGVVLGLIARVFGDRFRRLPALALSLGITAFAIALACESELPCFRYLATRENGLPVAILEALLDGAPLLVAMTALVTPKRAAGFAVGAAMFTLWLWWYSPAPAPIAVLAFIFARDAGALDASVPARQSLAIVGTGVLMVMFARGLAHDLLASIAADRWAWDFRCSIVADAAITRWPRMIVEAAIVASGAAHLRGRSWGVIGLVVFGTAFVVLLVASDLRLPYWGGCMITRHPFDPVWFLIALVIAAGPWLAPITRRMRA